MKPSAVATSRGAIGHPRYLASCLLRVLIIWGAIRGGTEIARGMTASPSAAGAVEGPTAALVFAGIVCVVVLIDAAATRELVYLRNLGLPARWLAALSILTVLVLEIVFHAIA